MAGRRTSNPSYGDNEYKGAGIIKCAACDRPLRDHRIGPCPSLQTDVIHVARPKRRENTSDPNRGRLKPRRIEEEGDET